MSETYPRGRYQVRYYPGGQPVIITVKHRWFPWLSRNVVFGSTIYEGGPEGLNLETFRHELRHTEQYAEHGWWWVWSRRHEAEADAHSMERVESYPAELTLKEAA